MAPPRSQPRRNAGSKNPVIYMSKNATPTVTVKQVKLALKKHQEERAASEFSDKVEMTETPAKAPMSRGKKRAVNCSEDEDENEIERPASSTERKKQADLLKKISPFKIAKLAPKASTSNQTIGGDKDGDVFEASSFKPTSTYNSTSVPSPRIDESDVGTRDPKLRAGYKYLANIKVARIHSWSDKLGDGQPWYSAVFLDIPDINKVVLESAVTFQHMKNYANLSRVDPALISTGFAGQTYFHLLGGGAQPLILTSVIIISECMLLTPKVSAATKPIKVISGGLFAGEWERFVGAVGMVIGAQDFGAQLFKDNLSFTTAPALSEDAGSVSSPTKKSFTGVPSPFTRRAPSLGSRTVLSCTDSIPIYDGRLAEADFPSTLKSLQNLPLLDEEIPRGACAVVGYTANTFFRRNSSMKSVSFNVHFAILLGEAAL